MFLSTLSLLALLSATAPRPDPSKPYRLPSVDLKQPIIWGAVCEEPEGQGLAFGGQDQRSEDGKGHTRIKMDGKWVDISNEFRRWLEPKIAESALKSLKTQPIYRRAYFDGGKVDHGIWENQLLSRLDLMAGFIRVIAQNIELEAVQRDLKPEYAQFLAVVCERLQQRSANAKRGRQLRKDLTVQGLLQEINDSRIEAESLFDLLLAEPTPRRAKSHRLRPEIETLFPLRRRSSRLLDERCLAFRSGEKAMDSPIAERIASATSESYTQGQWRWHHHSLGRLHLRQQHRLYGWAIQRSQRW